ncbi:DUF4129 domain-containing protein [Cellulosimicrobium sp. NPDC057127]|uniref:DUF4129 domain-containing protein n=1 Tax=Cellulosimicrobium sp. NPDC057127 TaxID=3346026 RepID=UPI0036410E6E
MTTDQGARRRLVLVVALTTAVLAAAATAPPWTWSTPGWLGRLTSPTDPLPPPEPVVATTAPTETLAPTDPGGVGIGDVLLALTGLGLLVLVLLLTRALVTAARRGTQGAAPATTAPGTAVHAPDDTTARLRDAVHHAERHLTPRVPPRDAVVAAWVALEDAAARAGTLRDPAQTPTEFTVALLGRTPADPDAVTTLRRLYQRARFARAAVTTTDVDAARDALRRLAADLTVDPAVDHPTGDDA